ncbi:hypothetical protein [Vibrio phage vB_VpM-pA2SJ1]|uniref:Uncharacterized protein n=1 Tax=Vibrio phage vB_VpM-pA2SJ1 TaxID=3095964 RepID=A0AAX4J5S9_9CAUD
MGAVIQLATQTEIERIQSALTSYDEYTEIHAIDNPPLYMGLKSLERYLEGGEEFTRKEIVSIKEKALHEAKVEQRFAKQCCDISNDGANPVALECANDIVEAIEAVEII